MGLIKGFRKFFKKAGRIIQDVADVAVPIAIGVAAQSTGLGFLTGQLGGPGVGPFAGPAAGLLGQFLGGQQPAAPSQTFPTQTRLSSQQPLLRGFMPPGQFPQPVPTPQPFVGSGNFNIARFGVPGLTVGSGSRNQQARVAGTNCALPQPQFRQPSFFPQFAQAFGFRSLF